MGSLADLKKFRYLSLGDEQRIEIVENSGWCRDLSFSQIRVLCGYIDIYKVPKGQLIFEEQSSENYLAIVAKGSVEILKSDSSEQQKVLATLSKGKALGEMSLIDGAPRSASAVASEETTLIVLTKAEFDRLLQDKPQLGVRILSHIALLLSQRLRQTSAQLVEYLSEVELTEA